MQLGYISKGLKRSLTNREIWEILEHIKKKAAVNTAEKQHIKMSHDSQVAYGICRQNIFLPWLPRVLIWSCNFSRRWAKLAVISLVLTTLFWTEICRNHYLFKPCYKIISATPCNLSSKSGGQSQSVLRSFFKHL